MTTRHWWFGIGALVLALVFHAAFPRYEWRSTDTVLLRIDRWTGRVTLPNGRELPYELSIQRREPLP